MKCDPSYPETKKFVISMLSLTAFLFFPLMCAIFKKHSFNTEKCAGLLYKQMTSAATAQL